MSPAALTSDNFLSRHRIPQPAMRRGNLHPSRVSVPVSFLPRVLRQRPDSHDPLQPARSRPRLPASPSPPHRPLSAPRGNPLPLALGRSWEPSSSLHLPRIHTGTRSPCGARDRGVRARASMCVYVILAASPSPQSPPARKACRAPGGAETRGRPSRAFARLRPRAPAPTSPSAARFWWKGVGGGERAGLQRRVSLTGGALPAPPN